MRGEREKRETTAIESQENAAMPLQLPLPHGRHDGGSNKGLPCARVQSSEHPYGRVERGFSTASLGSGEAKFFTRKAFTELRYRIEYSPEAEEHLRFLTARQRATVLDTVDEQLIDEPTVETRNRKPMRPNPRSPWELRSGNLRVYYDVEE